MPTVHTNDVETYYERRGEGSPIVFVHGAVMDHSMYDAQVEALETAYTTVTYDIRGHGRTGGSTRESYSVDLYADDLEELLSALDLEKPVLCGLSLGGCIAQVYAARHPDDLGGLVLADTFTPALSRLDERLQLAMLRVAVVLVHLVGYERIQRGIAWIHERFNPGASGDYESIERLQAEMPPMETDEFVKVLRSLLGFTDETVDFSAISVPTTILYGEHVPSFFRRQAGILGREIPDATVRVVPGGGHASNLDNPEFFTDAIREVLARASERGED